MTTPRRSPQTNTVPVSNPVRICNRVLVSRPTKPQLPEQKEEQTLVPPSTPPIPSKPRRRTKRAT